MTIQKHPLHAEFDEVLAEKFKVEVSWYFSKINFVFIFFIANYLWYFFIKFKDQGCNFFLLVIEIDKEITEIFKVKGKAQFPKWQCDNWRNRLHAYGNKVEVWIHTFGKYLDTTLTIADNGHPIRSQQRTVQMYWKLVWRHLSSSPAALASWQVHNCCSWNCVAMKTWI